jgi:hypothetical protein
MDIESRILNALEVAQQNQGTEPATLLEQAREIIGEDLPMEFARQLIVTLQALKTDSAEQMLVAGAQSKDAAMAATFVVFLVGVAAGKGLGIEEGERLGSLIGSATGDVLS